MQVEVGREREEELYVTSLLDQPGSAVAVAVVTNREVGYLRIMHIHYGGVGVVKILLLGIEKAGKRALFPASPGNHAKLPIGG
jgi:hypothetical protein